TDGGRFVPEAFANGAAGVLVRDGLDVDGPAVSVRSTGEALMMLARDDVAGVDRDGRHLDVRPEEEPFDGARHVSHPPRLHARLPMA
ncbi:MAG: hypothetical protein ACXVEI_09210, partial [Actinomycetota bacterium]